MIHYNILLQTSLTFTIVSALVRRYDFHISRDSRVVLTSSISHDVADETVCATLCADDALCQGVNFDSSAETCEMQMANSCTPPCATVAAPGISYIGKQTLLKPGEFCSPEQCFQLGSDLVPNQEAARLKCNDLGGSLIRLDTTAKSKWILDNIRSLDPEYDCSTVHKSVISVANGTGSGFGTGCQYMGRESRIVNDPDLTVARCAQQTCDHGGNAMNVIEGNQCLPVQCEGEDYRLGDYFSKDYDVYRFELGALYYTDGIKKGSDWVWGTSGDVITNNPDWTTYSKPVDQRDPPVDGDCLAINSYGRKSWNRIPCDKQMMYLCEF